jgi:hypothetical protein
VKVFTAKGEDCAVAVCKAKKMMKGMSSLRIMFDVLMCCVFAKLQIPTKQQGKKTNK